jgi:glycosyltransferase involved in cell wall biosynthesis
MKKIKIIHIITGLNTGGAEIMLYKLLCKIDNKKFDNIVVSMTATGNIEEKIKSLGVRVEILGMKKGFRGFFSYSGLLKFKTIVKEYKPDIIQSWMYHADLFGLIIGKLYKIPVIWNIRCSNMELSFSTKVVVKLCSLLSKLPEAVIVNSNSGKEYHEKIGYSPKKLEIIQNGFDIGKCRPNESAKLLISKELKIRVDSILIGMIARFDPMKDHKNFLEAFSLISKKYDNVYGILAGDGIDNKNQELNNIINKLNIGDKIYMLGRREDVNILLSGIDILSSSSSYGEGFSNAIGEAMACEIPCVVTDVGDSALIVGETGIVVPPRNYELLAEGLLKMIELGEKRKELGIMARKRVINNWSIDKIVKKYENLYESICAE